MPARHHHTSLLPLLLLPLAAMAVGCGSDAEDEPTSTVTTTVATTVTTGGGTGAATGGTGAPPAGVSRPAIVVDEPAVGDGARSPLRVSGSANVFEAVLFVELRDGARLLDSQRVMATAGTGTRGTFAASLRFDAAGVTAPVLIAYTRSPRDGSRENEVRVPLRAAGT